MAETTANQTTAWQTKVNPWLIAFVVSLAAFMEVLDTSIANVALPHIAGNLGASSDESTKRAYCRAIRPETASSLAASHPVRRDRREAPASLGGLLPRVGEQSLDELVFE
jgi:MFS family permease